MKANGFCEIYEYKDGTVTKKTSFNERIYRDSLHFKGKAYAIRKQGWCDN